MAERPEPASSTTAPTEEALTPPSPVRHSPSQRDGEVLKSDPAGEEDSQADSFARRTEKHDSQICVARFSFSHVGAQPTVDPVRAAVVGHTQKRQASDSAHVPYVSRAAVDPVRAAAAGDPPADSLVQHHAAVDPVWAAAAGDTRDASDPSSLTFVDPVWAAFADDTPPVEHVRDQSIVDPVRAAVAGGTRVRPSVDQSVTNQPATNQAAVDPVRAAAAGAERVGHPSDRSVTNQPVTHQPAVDPVRAAVAGGTLREQPVDRWVTNQPATNQQTGDKEAWCINMDGLTFKPGRAFAIEFSAAAVV